MRAGIGLFLVCVASATLSAAVGPPVTVQARAKGAQKVVIATVEDVQSTFAVNGFGDRLIYSSVRLRVNETLKGARADAVTVTLEGGTVGDITLAVSDMPSMKAGERAVMFLDATESGGHLPHGRGLGVLQLDSTNHVRGTSLSLDDVRTMVQAASK